jgi:hypothetical protein
VCTHLFVLNNHQTENCLASVLRYSGEAHSAEYLVVDDGSESGRSGLHNLVDAMKNLLRVDIRMVRHKVPLGYLQVNIVGG